MNTERLIRIIAGTFILLSLALAHIYNGANLLYSPTSIRLHPLVFDGTDPQNGGSEIRLRPAKSRSVNDDHGGSRFRS